MNTVKQKPPERKLVVLIKGVRCNVSESMFWDKKRNGVDIKVVEIKEPENVHVDA